MERLSVGLFGGGNGGPELGKMAARGGCGGRAAQASGLVARVYDSQRMELRRRPASQGIGAGARRRSRPRRRLEQACRGAAGRGGAGSRLAAARGSRQFSAQTTETTEKGTRREERRKKGGGAQRAKWSFRMAFNST